MRLLQCDDGGRFTLSENFVNKIPRYAILSHTWGPDATEVTYKDIVDGSGESKVGYDKIRFCGTQAARDDLQYFWIDTCCIDKSNSTELAEAINSMFSWYRDAAKCYVYLPDVRKPSSNAIEKSHHIPWESTFRRSRWFTRGWTLQELIAPQTVEFFCREGYVLGDKKSLEEEIHQITGIALEALRGERLLQEFSVDERMSWAKDRETTRHEDAAYCLLGIFDVHMPLLYGEGREKALNRLRKEIRAQRVPSDLLRDDQTLSPDARSRTQSLNSFTASFNNAPVDLLSIHFMKRERELSIIRNAHQSCEEDAPARCAIWGIPGVGKTQLALRYTKIFLEDVRVSAVFWISCSNAEKLHQGFSQILDIVDHPDQSKRDHNSRLLATRRWLERPESCGIHRWLLVLDDMDVTTLGFLREHLPRQGKLGRILITTRTQAVAHAACKTSGRLQPSFELDPPAIEDAVSFFLKSVDIDEEPVSSDHQRQVADLMHCLGCLPFAIEHAASFVNQSRQSIDSFTKLYRGGQRSQIFNWQHLFTAYEAQSISSMFTSRLHNLRRSSPEALDLLSIIVFWDSDSIEFETIRTGALSLRSLHQPTSNPSTFVISQLCNRFFTLIPTKILYLNSVLSTSSLATEASKVNTEEKKTLPSQLESMIRLASSEVQLHSALRQLQMLSFIKQRSARKVGAYCMHDLTQSWVQMSLKSEGTHSQYLECAVSVACAALRQIKDPTLPESWHQCEGLISHILSLTRYTESVERQNADLLRARIITAAYWHNRGRYHDAHEIYQQLLDVGGSGLKDAGNEMIRLKLGLADVCWHLGNFNQSISLYDEVQETRKSQLGADHPEVLQIIEQIALIYRSQGEYAKARSMLEHVLESRRSSLGPDHLDTIRAMDNLAHTITDRAEAYNECYGEAEILHKQALARREARLGRDHLDTLWSADNLATNYRAQGRHLEAVHLHERVLKGRELQLGKDHPQTIYTLANLASVYSSLDRLEEAEVMWNQLIVVNEQQRGGSHSQTLFAVEGLADVCLQQSRFEEAISLYDRALRHSEESLGDRHPTVLRRTHKLANLYRDHNKVDMSIALFERLLERRSTELSAGHPTMIQTYNDAATSYILAGKYVEAEKCYRCEIAGSIEVFGSLHSETKARELKLNSFLRDQGKAAGGQLPRAVENDGAYPSSTTPK